MNRAARQRIFGLFLWGEDLNLYSQGSDWEQARVTGEGGAPVRTLGHPVTRRLQPPRES